MKAGTFSIQYNVDMMAIDRRTRDIKDRRTFKNLITNKGLEIMAKLLNGVTTTAFSAIAIGTDNTTANAGDTTLTSEVQRGLADLVYEADYKARFTLEFTFPSGMTIYECGIFDDITTGGNMLNHAIADPGIAVDEDTNLTVDIRMTVAEGS